MVAPSLRVVALLATYNEERFIAACLENLVGQGISVYLIDNESTDATVGIAERFRDRGVIGIETLPRRGVFELRKQLRRKEELARSLEADWFLHVDADEIHRPLPPYATLEQALAALDAQGWNAVNFMEFTFVPTREEPDHDHDGFLQTMLSYYPFAPVLPHRLNAWKRQPMPVELAWSAGHQVRFPRLRAYPGWFPMRHYLFLSPAHAIRKYTQQTFDPTERGLGWFGWRCRLKPERITLPSASELRRYHSDDRLDATCPRAHHVLDQ